MYSLTKFILGWHFWVFFSYFWGIVYNHWTDGLDWWTGQVEFPITNHFMFSNESSPVWLHLET